MKRCLMLLLLAVALIILGGCKTDVLELNEEPDNLRFKCLYKQIDVRNTLEINIIKDTVTGETYTVWTKANGGVYVTTE